MKSVNEIIEEGENAPPDLPDEDGFLITSVGTKEQGSGYLTARFENGCEVTFPDRFFYSEFNTKGVYKIELLESGSLVHFPDGEVSVSTSTILKNCFRHPEEFVITGNVWYIRKLIEFAEKYYDI